MLKYEKKTTVKGIIVKHRAFCRFCNV